ncbi:MAG TPA: hypothetical protein VKS44_12450 [Candidatus Acidoferrales bacterium]|nr:hypothetical protein [Candidatus Acidoferrales bacterium]
MSETVTPPPADRDYVDFQPGWRIKVVTPILRSGGFVLKEPKVEQEGGDFIVRTGNDFVGYEIAYYLVRERSGRGVLIRFSSAEKVTNGNRKKESRPLVPLFDFPSDVGFVRLFVLTRVSKADHNQGILAAPSRERLIQATRGLEANPERNCRTEDDTLCFWIPQGIAVQPEKRDPKRRKHWIPAW